MIKKYLCPFLSVTFYLVYFFLLQGAVYILPETRLTPLIVIASVFFIIPVIASRTSGLLMRKLNGISCSM